MYCLMLWYFCINLNQFKRSYKKLKLTDSEDLAYIDIVYNLLCNIELVDKYKDHQPKGNMKDFRECCQANSKSEQLIFKKYYNLKLKPPIIPT